MSLNSSYVTHFVLSAYSESGLVKYLCFLVVLSLYVLMLLSNVLLIVVIWVNRTLREPMYLFLCSLFVNELYGSTAVFPFLLVQILSDVHTVPASFCFLQVFCGHSYALMEILTLAVMSYDRYLAICHPLQYHARMSRHRIVSLIAAPWFYTFIICSIMISLSSSLRLCGNVIDKVLCDNYPIIKLACSDTTVLNIYGLIITFTSVLLPVVLIFFSYMRILQVCFSGSKQTRHKAVSTCAPHLASLFNFTLGASFEVVQGRFNMNKVPSELRIFLSLYFLTCQPLLNPLMYGLNISKIRMLCKQLLFTNM